ncbi:MAG: hypothetical protein P1P88_06990 [Bacteroidales bacterium]|nr:hypothetical protein [Bacteroidales bacterium]
MKIVQNKYNPSISVDCVIFGFDSNYLKVLLVDMDDYNDEIPKLKLPGSLVLKNEKLDTYACQVLNELTGLDNIYLKQFHTFGNPGRIQSFEDKKWIENTYSVKIERIVSTAYYSLVKIDKSNSNPREKSYKANWHNVVDIEALAFDHQDILNKGLSKLQKELFYNPQVCFELLPEKFTLRDVQNVYEAIQGITYDNRNFRKKISKAKYIKPLNEKQTGVAHKPALLYKFDKVIYDKKRTELGRFLI